MMGWFLGGTANSCTGIGRGSVLTAAKAWAPDMVVVFRRLLGAASEEDGLEAMMLSLFRAAPTSADLDECLAYTRRLGVGRVSPASL